MSRRLRAAYAATIEPLRLGVSLGLDYGLLSTRTMANNRDPDSRCRREVVSVEKRGAASSGGRSSSAETRPAPTPGKQIPPPTGPISEASETPAATAPTLERRAMGACVLGRNTRLCLNWRGVERTARVLDLGYGGVALETARPEELGNPSSLYPRANPAARFSRQLAPHLFEQGSTGSSRVGCAFVT